MLLNIVVRSGICLVFHRRDAECAEKTFFLCYSACRDRLSFGVDVWEFIHDSFQTAMLLNIVVRSGICLVFHRRDAECAEKTFFLVLFGLPRSSFFRVDVWEFIHDSFCVSRRALRLGGERHYGYSRWSIRGNGIVSRTCSRPQIQATARSMPIPKPECGTLPNFRRSRYHLKASSGSLCS
jgi:hypothetical protein